MFVKRYVEVEFISQKHEILRVFNKLGLWEKKLIVMFFYWKFNNPILLKET